MKGTKMMQPQQPRPQIRTMKGMPIAIDRHELMMRRTTNHNVHMLTPHGKVQLGRKGRKG